MSSITLYRKYRPQSFADIVNQDHVKSTIQQEFLTESLPHAFLFHGPRGVGKTTMARVLAKLLNCTKRKAKETEPCNACESCENIVKGKSLNIVEIDAASHTQVDNVRDNIIANARVAVSGDAYKVFIIDEVHMLSTASFNALLKTLEEPPERVIFILATTEIHKIPETIISRCQRFDFHPITSQALKEYLKGLVKKEKRKVDDDVLATIAQKSAGHVRDAMSLLGQVLSLPGEVTAEAASMVLPVTNAEHLIRFFELVSQKQTAEALRFLHEIDQRGLRYQQYADSLIEFAHQLMLIVAGSHPDSFKGLVSDDQLNDIQAIAARYTMPTMLQTLDVLLKRRQHLKDYNQGKLPLELAVIELTAGTIPPPSASGGQPSPKGPNQNTYPNQAPSSTPTAPIQSSQSMPSAAPTMSSASSSVGAKPQAVPQKNEPAVEVQTLAQKTVGEMAAEDEGKPEVTFAEMQAVWPKFMVGISEKLHSAFIILRTVELRSGSAGEPCLAFRFRMHHDHVKRYLSTLIAQGRELLPEKAIRFTLVVDENMDYSTGADFEEPKKEEKEALSKELSELAEAFGGSLME